MAYCVRHSEIPGVVHAPCPECLKEEQDSPPPDLGATVRDFIEFVERPLVDPIRTEHQEGFHDGLVMAAKLLKTHVEEKPDLGALLMGLRMEIEKRGPPKVAFEYYDGYLDALAAVEKALEVK